MIIKYIITLILSLVLGQASASNLDNSRTQNLFDKTPVYSEEVIINKETGAIVQPSTSEEKNVGIGTINKYVLRNLFGYVKEQSKECYYWSKLGETLQDIRNEEKLNKYQLITNIDSLYNKLSEANQQATNRFMKQDVMFMINKLYKSYPTYRHRQGLTGIDVGFLVYTECITLEVMELQKRYERDNGYN